MAHDPLRRVNARSPQLPLDFAPPPSARFETFVGGPNSAAVDHAAALAAGRGGALWLYGAAGTGKSHLLQAACVAAASRGRRAMYVPLAAADPADPADPADAAPDALADLEALDLLALDDVDRVAGDVVWERRLFAIFNDVVTRDTSLVLAARAAPRALAFALPDLASRACGAAVYRLQPLADQDRAQALIAHATARGFDLEPAAAEYLLTRVARDMHALASWIERFDRATLAEGKRLTMQFVRELINAKE